MSETTLTNPDPATDSSSPAKGRRSLLKAVLAVLVGAGILIAPVIPGLALLTSPLRRKKGKGGQSLRITTLDALQGSNLPQRFQVVATRRDAWNEYPPEPIAGVYLVPQGDGKPPRAFSTTCPHLGCAVDYKNANGEYQCPCHTSAFALDGQKIYGPSPRGLDELPVEIRNGNEIWIDYQRFQIGTSKKIAV